jgi:hypothetical protein
MLITINGEVREKITAGQYWPAPNDQVLDAMGIISEQWPTRPPHRHLHVFVLLPPGECCIRLLVLAQDI